MPVIILLAAPDNEAEKFKKKFLEGVRVPHKFIEAHKVMDAVKHVNSGEKIDTVFVHSKWFNYGKEPFAETLFKALEKRKLPVAGIGKEKECDKLGKKYHYFVGDKHGEVDSTTTTKIIKSIGEGRFEWPDGKVGNGSGRKSVDSSVKTTDRKSSMDRQNMEEQPPYRNSYDMQRSMDQYNLYSSQPLPPMPPMQPMQTLPSMPPMQPIQTLPNMSSMQPLAPPTNQAAALGGDIVTQIDYMLKSGHNKTEIIQVLAQEVARLTQLVEEKKQRNDLHTHADLSMTI